MKLSVLGVMVIVYGGFGVVESVRFFNRPIPIPLEGPEGQGHPGNRDDDTQGSQFLVNHEDDGSYHFGYHIDGGSSYREEMRDASGRIFGRYAIRDPQGNFFRITEYVADEQGFRSTETKRFLFDNSELQLIGPIPKPLHELYKSKKPSFRSRFSSH